MEDVVNDGWAHCSGELEDELGDMRLESEGCNGFGRSRMELWRGAERVEVGGVRNPLLRTWTRLSIGDEFDIGEPYLPEEETAP